MCDACGNSAKDSIEYLMGKLNAFVDRVARGDHPDVHLALPGQPDAGNEAGTEIDHSTVDARHVGVWIKHATIVGEDKVKIVFGPIGAKRSVL